MARVALDNYARLFWLVVRCAFRRLRGRFSSPPAWRWPFLPLRADRLLIAPQDLRTADATRASELYSGRFAFAGKVVVSDGRSIFEMEPPSQEWAVELLGFGWLRHLRAAESAIARANGRALVQEWMTLQGSGHPLAWRTDVLSRRIISWLSQAPLLLQDADLRFYRRFLRSLVRQVRYLRHSVGAARSGMAHMEAVIALADAALCLAGQGRRIKSATERLRLELQRQILPDGGHISRNPGANIEILLDLLPLRQAYSTRNIAPPQPLLNAIDRMMPMLRFFCHSDGSFAHFNGMDSTPADLLLTLLAYDDNRGAPLSNAPHSGYQRLEAGGGVLIMDVGRPPPMEVSLEAHAGCLSFEFSTPKQNLLIVNCGVPPTAREEWRQLARATPAHSTVTFNDASSARIVGSSIVRRMLGGAPILVGPRQVTVARDDSAGPVVLQVRHDGYADRYGLVHERTIVLSADGTRLDGEDGFLVAAGRSPVQGARDKFAIRFHLHPSVKASRLSDGHGAMLVAPNKDLWTFSTTDGRLDIEDSVYLSAIEGPRRTVQLVIHGSAGNTARVAWSLQQAGTAAFAKPAGRGVREEEPKLPL